jgi:hypothetical protein
MDSPHSANVIEPLFSGISSPRGPNIDQSSACFLGGPYLDPMGNRVIAEPQKWRHARSSEHQNRSTLCIDALALQ